jgi:hypothetical protein
LACTKSRRSVVQALAGRSHGGEGDGADCQIKIGRGRDNGGVIATKLEDRAGETGSEARADGATHGKKKEEQTGTAFFSRRPP